MESWFAVSDKGHGCFCDFERSRNEAIEKERADQNRKYIRICGERDLSSSLFDCIDGICFIHTSSFNFPWNRNLE